MAISHFSGPLDIYGYAYDPARNDSVFVGPSSFYGGTAIPDTRVPYAPGVGSVRALGSLSNIVSVDCVPWAANAAAFVAAATATSGTAMTIKAASNNGVYVNVPIVPAGKSLNAANVVKVAMIGPGTASGTTTSTSASVTAVNNAALLPGMWVCIPDAGGTNTPLIAQILTQTEVTSGTVPSYTLKLSVVASVSVSNAAIFVMDSAGIAVVNYISIGKMQMFDAYGALGRGFSVTSNNAADTGWTVTAKGYDTNYVPMTETVSVSANSVAYSKKAFKGFISFTPTNTGSTTGTLSLGTSDVVGLNVRMNLWEYSTIQWAGATVAANTGIATADGTAPATATTGDVRGTAQLSAAGSLGSGIGTTATNGTAATVNAGTGRRLFIASSIPMKELAFATYANTAPLFGVTQF